MRIVNGKLLDDAVDEPEDYCEDCGEWRQKLQEEQQKQINEAWRKA